MPTRIIHCTFCGLSGEIEIRDLEAHDPQAEVFKHLGHNPFSGHMHFRCPACGIVLLVNPIDVLGEKPLSDDHTAAEHIKRLYNRYGRSLSYKAGRSVTREDA